MRLLWAVLLVVLPLVAEFATAQKCPGQPDAPEHASVRCFKKRGTCRASCDTGYIFPSKNSKMAIYDCEDGNWVMKGGEDRCTPHCEPPCENGDCVEPDVCECDEGFTGDHCEEEEEYEMEPTEASEAYEDEEEYGDDYEEDHDEYEGEEHEDVASTDEPEEEDDHDHDADGAADHEHAEHADHGPLDDDHDHDADGAADHEHAEHADHGPLDVAEDEVEAPEAEPTAAETDAAATDEVETVDDSEDGAETAAYGGVSEVVPKILVGSAALLIVRAL